MNDPVQLLIDAGAIPSSPFPPSSRYHGVALAVFEQRPGDPGIVYVRRRFMEAPAATAAAQYHVVTGRDRPDLLAARYLGDVLLYWRIADANAVVDPHELTAAPGRRIVIPRPPGT
jgi:hypothetical protein